MEIWIGRDGERHGPYKEDDVRAWLRSGQLSAADLAWHEGLADWQPLSVLFPDETRSVPAAPSTTPLPSTNAATLEDCAGFWKRFAAWVIDYLILLVPVFMIALSMGATTAFEHFMTQIQGGATPTLAMEEYARAVRPATMWALLVGYLYYAFFECSAWQATPGKLALGLRVTDLEGRRISLGRSLARNAVRLTNVLTALIPLVCYLAVAWTTRKQGFHDLLAKTLVLNGRASEFKPSQAASGNGNTFRA
ncbi:RDD family protein [Rhodanobacter sp. B2A1Ga4]|uniref:RDD family protein n=1 Tax=Rhodanobacter TaxID=75309 RepID=UPI000D36EB83|nr:MULTISPECIES: RDD family protein [Rhodanobacter]MBQ4856039.1 RDD family protein [Rhodanobacter sp. B2A1Ga4]